MSPRKGPQKSKKKTVKKNTTRANSENGVRLNKFIANAGICSRREADTMIEAGLISINGGVVTGMGTKVMPGDDVRYNGERIAGEKKVYVLMNKPKDCVTTVGDPNAAKTVMQIIGPKVKERIYPVGRLDRNTTGVLLLTNDGELTKRLTHPRYNKKKIYHVYLNNNVTHADMKKITEGIELEDGFIAADEINYVDDNDKKQVGIEIHSGKNRIVRRIFAHFDYKVIKLDRVYFAGLTKKGLRRGHWRFLNEKEINRLKMNAYE